MTVLPQARVARLAECRLLNRRRVTSSTPTQNISTPTILNVLIQMKNDNKAESTIKFTDKSLTVISKQKMRMLIVVTILNNNLKPLYSHETVGNKWLELSKFTL